MTDFKLGLYVCIVNEHYFLVYLLTSFSLSYHMVCKACSLSHNGARIVLTLLNNAREGKMGVPPLSGIPLMKLL